MHISLQLFIKSDMFGWRPPPPSGKAHLRQVNAPVVNNHFSPPFAGGGNPFLYHAALK
jgi:hypothetical protein